jgi:ketosteroid isomerase-like protein
MWACRGGRAIWRASPSDKRIVFALTQHLGVDGEAHEARHWWCCRQKGGKAMKIKQAISSAILVVLLTAPMAWAQDNIRAAMEAANNEWSAAYNSLNGKAFPALYTKDAVLMPPGVQPINGSEAIGRFWTDLIKAGNRKNFAIEIASIQRDGKYAYQTGRWTLDLVKDNGEVTKVVGSTVRIFEEQPDGKWLAKVHIYNVY